MSKRTGMTDSQIVDEVLYTGLGRDAGAGCEGRIGLS